jgi:hypothetical protein
VVKIPFGEGEVAALADFFTRELPDPAAQQARWLRDNATLDLTVDGYLRAIAGGERTVSRTATAAVPLFPRIEASVRRGALTLRNSGDMTLRTRSYGAPGYRLMMLTFDGTTVLDDRWIELPRDLAPGEQTSVPLPPTKGTLRLYHAIEGVPMLDPEPFAELETRGAL